MQAVATCGIIKTLSFPQMLGFLDGGGGQDSERSGLREERNPMRDLSSQACPLLVWSPSPLDKLNGSRAFRMLQPKIFGHHCDLGGAGTPGPMKFLFQHTNRGLTPPE